MGAGCKCSKCQHAEKRKNENVLLCDNWESDYYGEEMDAVDGECELGEEDLFAKVLTELESEKGENTSWED